MKNKFTGLVCLCGLILSSSAALGQETFFAADRFSQMSALPGSSLGAPTGMVASQGSAFVGIGGIHNPDLDQTDGSVTVGMGLGNAIESVGATASVTVGSINNDYGFGERAALNLSVGKFFPDSQVGLAFGAVNLAGKNNITSKPDPSFFAALTKVYSLDKHPIILNVGLGTNDFVDVNYTATDRTNNVSPFASAGYYVNPHISLIADYTAAVGSVGASISPMHKVPLTLTLGVYDVTSDTKNYTAAVSYAFSY